jgi:hypothetical protein
MMPQPQQQAETFASAAAESSAQKTPGPTRARRKGSLWQPAAAALERLESVARSAMESRRRGHSEVVQNYDDDDDDGKSTCSDDDVSERKQ